MKVVYIIHTLMLLAAIAITVAVFMLLVRPAAGRKGAMGIGGMAGICTGLSARKKKGYLLDCRGGFHL